MTTPKRKCRLADTNHADIDLRDYEEDKLVFVTGDSPFEMCGKLYSIAAKRSRITILQHRCFGYWSA